MSRKIQLLVIIMIILVLSLMLFLSCVDPSGKPSITDDYIDNNDNDNDDETNTGTETEAYNVLAISDLNVRTSPEINNQNIIGIMKKNSTAVLISKYDSGWYNILYQGEEAYVTALAKYSRLLLDDEDLIAETIENIIDVGMSKLGVPYQYGSIRLLEYDGELNPSFTGKTFDCSAFVQYSFYMGGNIILQSTSRSQSLEGTLVSINDIRRGDIIFMTSTDRQYNTGIERIGHVAIYLGDNKILHTYGTGGVRVTDFDSFWRGRFILSRRML